MDEVEQIVYEQCPYNWQHVAELYRTVPFPPFENKWYAVNSKTGVCYRRRNGYFQFISGQSDTELWQEMLTFEPMETKDDAEWTIERHGLGEYLVRTRFSITYGPVDIQQEVHEELIKHGLWLGNRHTYVEGAALFDELTPSNLLYASRKLVMLENWCIQANVKVNSLIESIWKEHLAVLRQDFDFDGSAFETSSPKSRRPLSIDS